MSKFDKKDKKILYELDKNARQPLTKISKKVKLARESVLYRLNKYLKDGIIRNYLTVINMAKLGYTTYKLFLKFHNISDAKEKELINFLKENPNILWVSSCDGEYSLIFAVMARSVIELNEILEDINNRYWQYIKEKDTATIIKASHFYRDYLIEKKGTTERKIEWGGTPEEIKLDKINIIILHELSTNSRVSTVEIANKLNISSDAVIQRIKKLEKANIIEHYMIWPNVNKLHGLYYKVLITLHNINDEKKRKLYTYCLEKPNIVYIVEALGKWNFEMDIEVKNLEEFRLLIREFINMFSDIVSDYTALNIYDEYKYRFFDKGVM